MIRSPVLRRLHSSIELEDWAEVASISCDYLQFVSDEPKLIVDYVKKVQNLALNHLGDFDFFKKVSYLFDVPYYIKQISPDNFLGLTDLNSVIRHFCEFGSLDDLNPSHFFNTKAYLDRHPDFDRAGGANPLRKWLASGASFSSLGISENSFLQAMADELFANGVGLSPPALYSHRVAIVLHVFYIEQFSSCLSAIANIPGKFDVYVSTTVQFSDQVEAALMSLDGLMNLRLEIFPNIGRDIAPFFVGFAPMLLDYDYVLKIHCKKSIHNSNLNNWLETSLYALAGSNSIVQHHWQLLADPMIGLTMPPLNWIIAHAIARYSCWGYGGKNFYRCSRERHRLGLEQIKLDQTFSFPAGSMFWCKPSMLQPFVDLGLSWTSFDREAGQIDGTLAHSLERLIGLVCCHRLGLHCRSVWPLDYP